MESTRTNLQSLRRDAITQAFAKTKKEVCFPEGELVFITEDRLDDALSMPRQCFIDDEPMGKSIGVQFTEEFKLYWLTTFRQGLSFMLVNPTNGDIMGFRGICTALKEDKEEVNQIKDASLRKIFSILGLLVKEADFFGRYDIEECFHFFGLGVAKQYRKRGIAKRLMEAGIVFLRNLDVDPVYIKSEGTSNFSQKTFEQLGFETLAEIKYEEYEVDGEVVFKNTGEHKSVKAYGMKTSKA
ncbi:arylalkylamine N-acetyltransferase 1-like [Mya arenaria]|uniref:arylalkylamine N-acetyltransferase 1-like n=1 Tax=Mya arenaria TaxID=6604 RepID=UPI0022E853D7|nr:arylalkylamine N-acetyltransferase 1-like [Mya arenaria]